MYFGEKIVREPNQLHNKHHFGETSHIRRPRFVLRQQKRRLGRSVSTGKENEKKEGFGKSSEFTWKTRSRDCGRLQRRPIRLLNELNCFPRRGVKKNVQF